MDAGVAAEQKAERPAVPAVIVPPSSAPPGGAAAQKARTGRRGSIGSAQSGSRGGSHRGSMAQKGAAGPGKYGRTGPGARGGPGGEHADGEGPGGDENEADEWESVQTKNTVQRVGLNLLNEQKRRRPEDISYERPPIKYEPSYQLKPDSDHRFSSVKVRTALKELIAKYVEQESDTYSQRAARRISVGLSELVKERIKSTYCGGQSLPTESYSWGFPPASWGGGGQTPPPILG